VCCFFILCEDLGFNIDILYGFYAFVFCYHVYTIYIYFTGYLLLLFIFSVELSSYKSEYQESISDIDAIKVEMNSVKTKVSRAELLLASLSAEQGRWEESAAQFHNQMSTIVGDGLLAAAFASYGGCFDHKNRKNLREEWGMIVSNLGIPHRTDLNDSLVEYLSRAKQVFIHFPT